MKEDELVLLYFHLEESAIILLDSGFVSAAKWSAEALNGLPPLTQTQELELKSFKEKKLMERQPSPLESEESLKILLAKTYFDSKEFDRAAHQLQGCKSARALVLRLYSQYISGQKKLLEEKDEILGEKIANSNQEKDINQKRSQVVKDILNYFKDHSEELVYGREKIYCSLLWYLLGMIYLNDKDLLGAEKCLLKSLKLYQYNWECWNDLIHCCGTFDHANSLINRVSKMSFFDPNFDLKDSKKKRGANNNQLEVINEDIINSKYKNIMFRIFNIVIFQEFFQQHGAMFSELEELIELLPNFVFLKTKKALILYLTLNYPLAESIFDEILIIDPYNLDHMDVFSNILYVMENKPKLSFLAQFANSIDKFRPETCCIIANYYSIKYEHEKAIMYYRRALTLNKNCLSAWTLMGHEFVELKNSHAAIESYRRAVDINQKDFRAWYGLGQAYEVLGMFLYSLYYYQKACELKPLDKRMWSAIGNCYEKLSKLKESIRAYQKILSISDEDNYFVYYKLGKLFELLKDFEKAEFYMELCLQEEGSTNLVTDETTKARLWLAKRELHKGNYKVAYEYAMDFNNGTGQEIEEARSIVRDCRRRI